jgi:hypothetical protein
MSSRRACPTFPRSDAAENLLRPLETECAPPPCEATPTPPASSQSWRESAPPEQNGRAGRFCHLGGACLSVGLGGATFAYRAPAQPPRVAVRVGGREVAVEPSPEQGREHRGDLAQPAVCGVQLAASYPRPLRLNISDKNRRYTGKSQSHRPPKRTQRTPHRSASPPAPA